METAAGSSIVSMGTQNMLDRYFGSFVTNNVGTPNRMERALYTHIYILFIFYRFYSVLVDHQDPKSHDRHVWDKGSRLTLSICGVRFAPTANLGSGGGLKLFSYDMWVREGFQMGSNPGGIQSSWVQG